jgi:hypothetical protein
LTMRKLFVETYMVSFFFAEKTSSIIGGDLYEKDRNFGKEILCVNGRRAS